MTPKPLAVQLYSLRERAQKDFIAVLKDVAAMGYKGVEPAGLWNIRPSRFRAILEDLGLDAVAAEAAYIWAAEQGLVTENLYEQLALGTDLGRQLVEVPHRTKSKAGKRRDASRGQIASAFSLPPEAEETAAFCANFAEAVSVCGQCLFTVKALEPGNAEMFLVRALECVTGQSWNLERLISLGACSRNLEKQLKKRFQK
jgi:sugar phosphate isomerase/epimerase